MAGRPEKIALDYSGWSVDIFDSDPKIDKLMDAQGCAGFVIYFYLCQRAYGGQGYYYEWSYDDAATTARKVGGGVGSEAVKQTVNLCLRIGLFDRDLFEGRGILTSRGIQKRYVVAMAGKVRKHIREDYWLLSDEESAGVVCFTQKSNFGDENANLSPGNANYPIQKEKERKEKKRRGESAREELERRYGQKTVELYLKKAAARNYQGEEALRRIEIWLSEDEAKGKVKRMKQDSFDMDRWERHSFEQIDKMEISAPEQGDSTVANAGGEKQVTTGGRRRFSATAEQRGVSRPSRGVIGGLR